MIDPIQNRPSPEYNPKKTAVKPSQAGSGGETFSLNYSQEGVLYEPSSNDEKETSAAAKQENPNAFRKSAMQELAETENRPPAASDAKRSSLSDTLRGFFARAAAVLKKVWSFIWENKPAESGSDTADITDAESGTDAADITDAEFEADAASITDAESGTADTSAKNIASGTEETADTRTESGAVQAAGGNAESGTIQTAGGILKSDTADTSAASLHAVNDPAILSALRSGNNARFQALLTEDGKRTFAKNSSLLTYYDSKGNLISPDASMQQRILHGDRGSLKR